MKAALLLAPGKLTVGQIAEPQVGDYDALCTLLYGAVCAGTDQHLLHGRFPWPIVKYPAVLGHESIGRVMRIGAKVRNMKVGDLVTRVGTPAAPDGSFHSIWGGFAQAGIAKDHQAMKEDGLPLSEYRSFRVNQVIPPDTDPAAATMIITWRETYSYSKRMGIGPGKSILIIGSGGNGLAFAAHARNLGASKVVFAGNPNRAQSAADLGVHHYLDYRRDDLAAELLKLQPDGFDFIIDAVGKNGVIDKVAKTLAKGGTFGLYGIDEWGKITINPHNFRGSFSFKDGSYDEAEVHDEVVALMREGKLDASVWLDLANPFPLDAINEALEAVVQRRTIKSLVRLT